MKLVSGFKGLERGRRWRPTSHGLADRRPAHVRRMVMPWQDGAESGAGRHRIIETVGLLRAEAAERTPQSPGVR